MDEGQTAASGANALLNMLLATAANGVDASSLSAAAPMPKARKPSVSEKVPGTPLETIVGAVELEPLP
ncbi:hypothetical protein IV04_21730 [Serratia sp. Ag1]|nr:hypothetical protein IV04_21730 [Serratia sp. Ag1]KFK96145.1 hypothetical protein JV45_06190 [Serratia sp. Ag2]